MKLHNNLFRNGHSKREVRQALKDHYVRDSKIIQVSDAVTGFSVGYIAHQQSALVGVAVFAGVFSALISLRLFIDQSNRNHFLHRLDWEDALKRKDEDEL